MKIVLLGVPIAKQRPRVVRGHAYNPQAEQARRDHYKALEQIRTEWKRLYPWADKYSPQKNGFRLKFFFFMPIPASWTKRKKKLFYSSHHVFRPDIDNILKYYLDILQGALYADDKQVHTIIMEKNYINNAEEAPRTEIEVL